tara:strand:- start:41 stop:1162 length:1122 start_codon:yes stop_codon:yes gene_type:complete
VTQADPNAPHGVAMSALRRTLASVLLMCTSLFLTLGLLEIYVRLLVPESVFALAGNIYSRVDTPGVGYTMLPDFQGTAFGVHLETNHLGFRGPDWELEKPAGVFRIALIGDSHAFGYGVHETEAVAQQLQKRLAERCQCEVLNFAVPGYNSHQELAVLEQYALSYQPDLVILQVTSNDDEPAMVVDDAGWRYLRRDPEGGTIRMVDRSLEMFAPSAEHWLAQKSKLWLFARISTRKFLLREEARTRQAEPAAEASGKHWMDPFVPGPVPERLRGPVYVPLLSMISMARDAGACVILASATGMPDYRHTLHALSEHAQVPLIELYALFPEAHNWSEMQQKFSLGWDSHLNADAHARWAKGLAAPVETSPCFQHS